MPELATFVAAVLRDQTDEEEEDTAGSKKTTMNINNSNDGPRRSERVAKRNDERRKAMKEAGEKAEEKAGEKARDEEIERIVRVLLTEDLAHLVTTSHLSFPQGSNRHHLLKALASEVKNLERTKEEAKRDEVQSKPPEFDNEMVVVCYVLEIAHETQTVMRKMRCFATVDDTIKACHQLDQRLSEWTWSKLLVFAKWRAKNQDADIGEFEDYYDDYLFESGLDPLNQAVFERSYTTSYLWENMSVIM